MPKRTPPVITFGARGEDVEYRRDGKAVWIGFTWMNGPRLYPVDTIRWTDGSTLTDEEKTKVFAYVLRFVARTDEPPIVRINVDDASRALWENVCSSHSELVRAVEYTSDEQLYALEREGYLRSLQAGGLTIDGVEIQDEDDIDRVMSERRNRTFSGS